MYWARVNTPWSGARWPPHPAARVQDMEGGLVPAKPIWLWEPSPTTIRIAPGATVPLAPQQTLVPAALIFADESNTVTVAIGAKNIGISAGLPQGNAIAQIDAGRSGSLFTDDPFNEKLDLGLWFATHNDAVNTLLLYVTSWRVRQS